MAFGFIGQLVEAIMNGPEGSQYASMSMCGVDPRDSTTIMLPERAFQYWPETIQDSIEVGWNFKDIPGASHALAQWNANAGRTISFEIRLHRFMKPVKDRSIFELIVDPLGLTNPGQQILKDVRGDNVDVEAELRFLRAFCYPTYDKLEGQTVAYPPPVALLCVPGVGLNEDGSDTIFAVMTGCDITYNLLFPNGKPRNASVSLTFKQIVQSNKGVNWVGGSDNGVYQQRIPDGQYTSDAYEAAVTPVIGGSPAPGGARPDNDVKVP